MSRAICPKCNEPIMKVKVGGVEQTPLFCGVCSFPLKKDQTRQISSHGWVPAGNQLAVRVEPEELRSHIFSTAGISIDESQQGLLFIEGRYEQELSAGHHQLETLSDRLQQLFQNARPSAVLLLDSLRSLPVLGRLQGTDGSVVSYECEFAVSISDPLLFYKQVMQASSMCWIDDLYETLAPALRRAVAEVARDCADSELVNPHMELQQRFVDRIEQLLSAEAQRYGISVAYVAPPLFRGGSLAELQKQLAEYRNELRKMKLDQQFDAKKQEIELKRYQTARLLAEADMKVAIEQAERDGHLEQVKSELQHRMNVAGVNLKISWEDKLDEYAKRKATRDNTRADDESLREFTLRQVEIQREKKLSELRHDLQLQELKRSQEISDVQRTHAIREATEKRDAEFEAIEAKWSLDSKLRKAANQERRSEMEADAQSDSRIAGYQREQAATDFDELRRQKKAEQQDELERLRGLSGLQKEHTQNLLQTERQQIDNEAYKLRAEHDLSEAAKDGAHRRAMEEQQNAAANPLLGLGLLAKQAAEVPQLAASLGDAIKMEIAKGMTAEQLEILAAQQSPEVAKVLQERYRAVAEQQRATKDDQSQIELLREIIQSLKDNQDQSREQVESFMDRLERVGLHGQKMLSEVLRQQPQSPVSNNNQFNEEITLRLLRVLEQVQSPPPKAE